MSGRIAAVLSAIAVIACAPEPIDWRPAPRPIVERLADDELQIRWDRAPEGEIPVYAGPSPDAIDRTHPVARLHGSSVRVTGLEPQQRYFFELELPRDERLIVSERRIPLEGAHNFRDLGGYATSDGRRVRWGKLYRSDRLADLTDRDLAAVAKLDIALVCDFRGPDEVNEEPDRLPQQPRPRVAQLSIFDANLDATGLRDRILSGDLEGLDLAQVLIDANRAFVITYSDRYAAMFERVSVEENLPTLIHCTAGKDRAGFAAALLLLALGVPKETVIEDYLLTNFYTREQTETNLTMIRIFSLFRSDPEQVRPLFIARTDYLQAAFDAIDERYGSFDTYLREGLGVTARDRERLRDTLLR